MIKISNQLWLCGETISFAFWIAIIINASLINTSDLLVPVKVHILELSFTLTVAILDLLYIVSFLF